MSLIEAAIKFGVRPSALILGEDSREPWGEWDILIAEGYQIMQGERCSQCGLPVWICHNEDAGVRFDLIDEVCYAKREVDEEQDRLNEDKNYKRPPGQTTIPRPIVDGGAGFDWQFREDYYRREKDLRDRMIAARGQI